MVRVPLLGLRTVAWQELVTDVWRPWTLEVEALDSPPLRRWRLRLWLAADGGATRLRCQIWYAPVSLRPWLAAALFLRRAIHDALDAALAALARSFEPAPAEEDALEEERAPLEAKPAAA
jgi:hypothetical protein